MASEVETNKLFQNEVKAALDAFVRRYLACYEQAGRHYPSQPEDPDWPSPCVMDKTNEDGEPFWRPVKRPQESDLSAMADALALQLHPGIAPYFCTFYSDPLDATCKGYALQLLLPWNEQDFERLQQNLIGHVLMKRRLKQPETLFIACGANDEGIVAVDNRTGEVWVEWPGKLPHQKLADNLVQFLDELMPVVV